MTYRLICATSTAELAQAFGAMNRAPDLAPDYNTAPRDLAPAIRRQVTTAPSGERIARRVLVPARFGVLMPEPIWVAEKAGRGSGKRKEEERCNARADRLTSSDWAELFHHSRCVIPVTGYYEWVVPYPNIRHHKHVHAIRGKDGGIMALAALFDPYTGSRSADAGRFAVVTADCDDLKAAPLGYMPAILHGDEEVAAWLGETGASAEELRSLLRPTPADRLERWRVSNAVNDARNKGSDVMWRPAAA